MACRFEKGQHLFFLMRNGEASLDSQNKPRYYLSRDNAERYKHHTDEIVEYAPVRHGQWRLYGADKRGRGGIWMCTGCKGFYPYKNRYCPICGAKMR